ncbi:hypothetical protein AB6806_23900 [Bosea sp. RCC_152_1]|uniref:hypothetical protein n=1 Tax=Bosea sp. RCC_152_1 TaxID=3239228 RepID=UPI003526B17A
MSDLTDLFQAVGRLEGKVDAILSNQARLDKRVDDVEARVGALETKEEARKGFLSGAHWVVVAISAVVSFIVPYIPRLF